MAKKSQNAFQAAPRPRSGLKAVSLFSGCGGFCEGIERAGFSISVAVELDKFAAGTYRHNFPDIPLFEGDVHEFLSPENLNEHSARYGLQDIDLVFGGPPCQGFSQIGTRDLNDERNELYKQFVRVVRTLKPRLFLMENVPNLLLMNKGHFKEAILEEFRKNGYSNATPLKVIASDYGVPQDRVRVVFVGVRDDLALTEGLHEFCERALESLCVDRPINVWQAIGDLPEDVVPSGRVMSYPKKNGYSNFQKLMRLDFDAGIYQVEVMRQRGIGPTDLRLHNHHTKEIQDRRKRLISYLKPGQKADSLPKHIWNGARPEKWRRLHPETPSYTILAQMHRDLSEWVHPNLERWITVREAARLQSFHDGFVFVGSEWQQLKQIGNAVPPLLGYAVGTMASEVLGKLRVKRSKRCDRSAAASPEPLPLLA